MKKTAYPVTILFLGLILLSSSVPLPAKEKVQIKWSDLAPLITGRTVDLELREAVVRGKVVAVNTDSLVLNIMQTSDKRAYAKGSAEIPRPKVSAIRLKKNRIVGRIIGVSIGAALSAYLIHEIGQEGAGGIVTFCGLGYLFGWLADRHEILIQIGPD